MRRLPSLLLLLCLGAACADTQERAESPLEYSENAKRAYEAALVPYFERDWEEAALRLAELRRKYGYTRYARLSELRLADAAYHQDNFAEAVGSYKSFVHDYPNDPEVPYARFMVCRAYFDQSSASLLLPPLEERDLAAVQDAHRSITEFQADFPKYKRRRELAYMRKVVTGLLARHELYVARFYLREDRFEAAAARVEFALGNYGDSDLEAEGLVLLGEIRLMMHEPRQAVALFQQVLTQHPDSPFVVPARHFLRRLGKADPADPMDVAP